MTILTGPEITRQRDQHRLTIEPFHPGSINPNSYNLTLGPTLACYTGDVLDTRTPNDAELITIPDEGFVLTPDKVYLGHSTEIIGSDFYVPFIHSRSSAARLGLYVVICAALIDIGSKGQTTFQMHAVQPLRIYAGLSYAQVDFRATVGERVLYDGKYQGSTGPRISEIHRDLMTASA